MRHVYVAADADGRHKIGITSNPRARCRQLSKDLEGGSVEMVRIEPHNDNAFDVERRAHASLASYHEGGEWFRVDRAAANAALDAAISASPSSGEAQADGRKLYNGGRPRLLNDPLITSFKCAGSTREAIEDWRKRQSPIPNKSEAIRRLIEKGLAG